MNSFKLNQPIPQLQPIGSVSVLGATPGAGDPQAGLNMVFGTPTDKLSCGIFSATKGTFTMIYPFTEHATVLEGEVALTVNGETTHYHKGDSWFVEQGTAVEWEVLTDRFVKNYFAHIELR